MLKLNDHANTSAPRRRPDRHPAHRWLRDVILSVAKSL
jgi:hypothetical protein